MHYEFVSPVNSKAQGVPRANVSYFQSKASGRLLFEQVCKQLNLLETDYFGLEYNDNKGATVRYKRNNYVIKVCLTFLLILHS